MYHFICNYVSRKLWKMYISQNRRIFKKWYFHHFAKMSFFVKNHEKFNHRKIGRCHYDFFIVSNALTGAPKNAKICLYCIGYGKYPFLGNFLRFFFTRGEIDAFIKNVNFHHFPKNAGFSKFSESYIFVKMMKNAVSLNLSEIIIFSKIEFH